MGKKIYPVSFSALDTDEIKELDQDDRNIKMGAIRTGEFRYPKKGEWFVSGAVPWAYKAPNDLSMEYYIAKLVKYKMITKCEIIE